ncbi:hypothetical protein TCAL_06660 [Tigriopus californicus]|uniref:Prenyltransferase alpha-alpha toroid domain-containing protein n=1 Tax=Tigriopus californicus TaxID=6832 RepID=A0A553N7B0_TIGCA|nr:geranylgeranyl transferase type-1 subunit beta-like [Tigriopus californicus]TRY61325.1 hypothetical protein TCAL_06660 [Tigriopus californicus]|eukprot:TCALIF_06660-PA protein Name:"Similar to Pggt1b Geranylgeranyl transferase type-1 subunit beta (Rattus norvegicus)" AED:0.02 eAED:0.02 QI:0/-1/0/1/-1/1/1/0/351
MAHSTAHTPPDAAPVSLCVRRHAKYLLRALQVIPQIHESSVDANRMNVCFFGLSGLFVLPDEFNPVREQPGERARLVQWIKTLYVADTQAGWAGFHGGNTLRTAEQGVLHAGEHAGHVAMTYTALACLRLLDDPLTGLDRVALARGVAALQLPDGSFLSSAQGGESDMRFTYCATAISHFIQDWTGVDRDRAVHFILQSISYEGGIGQGPHLEAHGGSTYCGLAALQLMDRLDALGSVQRRKMIRWCVNRLNEGFNGRPNKLDDTCYTFWLGGALTILDPFPDIPNFIRQVTPFVLETQDVITGGLSKSSDGSADILHTYLGLAGLSLAEFPGLNKVTPTLNIAQNRDHTS